MTLTITEAENILSKVFATELVGGKVSIDNAAAGISSPPPRAGVYISNITYGMVLTSLVKDSDNKILAIKFHREANPGTGLAEAKEYVEKLMAL